MPDGLILTDSHLAEGESRQGSACEFDSARREDDGKCYDERELDPRQQDDACIINPASP